MATTSSKRTVARRRPRARPVAYSPPVDMHAPKRRHFDVNPTDHQEDDGGGVAVEAQMDWIGDKLSMLIAEGKKALGKEVVVMSDAPEDQVDDGTGAWEEEEDSIPTRPSSRAGSLSRRSGSVRQRPIQPSYAGSPPSSFPLPISPRKRSFAEPPSTSYHAVSASFSLPNTPQDLGGWTGEDGQSPELREYMEKARARYRGRQ